MYKKAYRKFKSHVYNDNTLLHVRIKLAEFEAKNDFEVKLNSLKAKIQQCTMDDFSPIKNYLDEITYLLMPKKVKGTSKN